VTQLVESFNKVTGERDELQAALDAHTAVGKALVSELEAERDALIGSLSEAAAAAQRAAMAHSNECKRLTQELAAKLHEEVQRAAAGEREAAGAKLQRLLGDLRAMADAQRELEEDLSAERAAVATIRETMAAEIETARAAGEGSAAELESARAEVERLKAEMAAAQSELTEATKGLQLKTDENMSLSERVRGLVKQHQEAVAQITSSREQLEQVLADLGLTRDENMSLGERVRHHPPRLTQSTRRRSAGFVHSSHRGVCTVSTHRGVCTVCTTGAPAGARVRASEG
jgi:DNA repair exonuclease SbcCD ATPase subunit